MEQGHLQSLRLAGQQVMVLLKKHTELASALKLNQLTEVAGHVTNAFVSQARLNH